jgi:hypothetical protein
MRHLRYWRGVTVSLSIAAGCHPPSAPSSDGGMLPQKPQWVVEGVAKPMPLPLTLALPLTDGGASIATFAPKKRLEIEPTQQLQLTAPYPLENFRIRVFDEADRAMVSDDAFEVFDGGTSYRIQLSQSLRPGYRYTIVVDPQTGERFGSDGGPAFGEQRFELKVVGERKREIPTPKRRRRR